MNDGGRLISQLTTAIKAVNLYPGEHPAARQPVQMSYQIISRINEGVNETSLAIRDEVLTLNDEPFYEGVPGLHEMMDIMTDKEIAQVGAISAVMLLYWQQLFMMLTLLITSKGIAGVPRASLVVLSGTLTAFGLPLEGIAVILGVDEVMDMARTMVNLVGNCLATAVVGRWEGELRLVRAAD